MKVIDAKERKQLKAVAEFLVKLADSDPNEEEVLLDFKFEVTRPPVIDKRKQAIQNDGFSYWKPGRNSYINLMLSGHIIHKEVTP